MKVYHNDASIEACLEHLPDTGFNVLNWGKQTSIAEVRRRIGDRMALMGNVNPLEIGVRGTTNLMMEIIERPEEAHRLLDLCTRVVIDWLKAQQKVIGETVEGIFVLDDIVGFVGEEHYLEFAHPYLKRICDAFPADFVKLYHNDASIEACLEHLPDTGFNVLNWGKQKDIREVKQRVGKRMCLMGNVNPLEIAVRGTPAEVKEATLEVLEGGASDGKGMILSVGGGTSPGMPSMAMQRSEKLAASDSRRLSWAASPNDINCAGGTMRISTGRR